MCVQIVQNFSSITKPWYKKGIPAAAQYIHVRIKTILGKVPLQSPKNNHVQFYIVLKVKLSMSVDVRLSINVSVIKAQGSNKFLDLTFLKILHASIHFLLHV